MKKFIEKIEWLLELGNPSRDIVFLVLSGIALLLSITKVLTLPFDIAWVAIILCGIPIIMEAVIGMVTEFDIKADVLVSLALVASVIIGEHFAAGEVAFIMQIGGLLEELTVAKARAGIEKLVRLTPQTARLINSGTEEVVPAENIKEGDILRVLPGETIPVDGIILSGETSINQAVMTGESLPIDKTAGDEVSSGTVNQFGMFEMKATKVGEDSSIQRMIRLVQSADADKAKIVGMADKWATWIVVVALVAAAITWAVSGEIIRGVTILVVFCPCALVLATPTAIMAAIGNATKHGFLVREGDALERLAAVSKITFDKTGTLTLGKLKVIAVKSIVPDISDEELYRYVASVESYSEHPIGKAITDCYKMQDSQSVARNREELCEIDNFEMIPGQGVSAKLDIGTLLAGNEKMLASNNVRLGTDKEDKMEETPSTKEVMEYLNKGCTVIQIALNSRYIGYVALSDTIREESVSMIKEIREIGVTPVLLTGDNENAAKSIASEIGIDNVYASCLPENKMHIIEQYQREGNSVCMMGDGINDAPALKTANVGIAMGGIGSDIAVDAADIALINDEVKELPHLIALSKRMMITIKCNLSFSMGLNFLAIILAITGVLNPVVGALVHNCGSVLVIINSALLLKWKKKTSV